MSRVGDSSDDQRIKEMQEAQFRKKVDAEKKDGQTRLDKSFNEVMGEKSRRQMAQKATSQQKETEDTQQKGRSVLDQVRQQAKKKKAPSELGRRAALARASNQQMAKKRSVDGQNQQVASDERVTDMSLKNEQEVERVEREVEREEIQEDKLVDEQNTEHRMENAQPDRVDPDGRGKQQQQQQQGKSGGDEAAKGVDAAEAARAHKVQIPPELIQQLVGQIFQAVNADGRTSLQLDLKGPGLDGVTLKIASENGRVSCSFEGCSQELKAALRRGKPALTRGLAKKGLKLVNLRVG